MTDDALTEHRSHPGRPPQGSPAELEATQRWWLTWIYGPVMTVIGLGALVTAVAGTGDRALSAAMFACVAGSLLGATLRFRAHRARTGRLAFDEREESQAMRSMGYGWCFAFFGALAWSVVWAATNESGVPVPVLVLAGLVLAYGLGVLCTRREGF